LIISHCLGRNTPSALSVDLIQKLYGIALVGGSGRAALDPIDSLEDRDVDKVNFETRMPPT